MIMKIGSMRRHTFSSVPCTALASLAVSDLSVDPTAPWEELACCCGVDGVGADGAAPDPFADALGPLELGVAAAEGLCAEAACC